jgi:hypothetical protein
MCDFHTLDSVADEVFNGKEVQAVKVDVEGAEQWVVEGGAKFFEKTNALLFIEAISVNFERFGTTVAKLLDLLKGFGYKTFKRYGYNYMCLK